MKRSYCLTSTVADPFANPYNLKVSDTFLVDGCALHLSHFFNIFLVPFDWLESTFKSKENLKVLRGTCWVLASPSSRYQVTHERNGVQTKLRLYQVSAVVNGKWPHHPLDDCSHLCHNIDCFNPDHVTWELKSFNNDRKKCEKAKKCVCKHTPKCLFNTT